MKKTALFLLIATLLTSGLFTGCGESEDNPNVSWDIPSTETMENNVSIDFDTEEIIDVESKETTGEATEPSDNTAAEDTSKQEDTTAPDIVTTPPETSAPETNPPVTTAPQTTNPPTSSTPNGFAVKAKKYTFEGNNLLLLDTENKTDTNYTVSVIVNYYNENGKQLKQEAQTFEGYAAGYQKYFLFNPGIIFDSYTYKVLVEEYSGECLASYIDIEFQKFRTLATPNGEYSGNARTKFKNTYNGKLDLYLDLIVFDSLGEIKFNDSYVYHKDIGYSESFKDIGVIDSLQEPLPEDWADGCSVIYIINDIKMPD